MVFQKIGYFAAMEVAVVILNWNGQKLLEQFLPSVVRYSEEATVYVADNASTDHSVDFIKRHFPAVQIIRNRANYGFAEGYNRALSGLNEELYILLNSDVEVTKGWLCPIIDHFKTHPDTAVAQPKLLDYKRKTYFEYAGAAGGFVDKYGYPFCRGRIFDTIEEDIKQYEEETPIFWASGACFVIRSSVYHRLAGMDSAYFAHQEEIDLCWRAFNLGYRVYYIPQSRVYHLGGATLDKSSPRKTYLNFRNSLFNLIKNIPSRRVYGILFVRLCLDGLAGFKFFIEGKPKHSGAIIRAHFDFYRQFRSMRRKGQHQSKRVNYAKLRSIAWQYYVKKRKKFGNLILLKGNNNYKI